MQQLFRQQQYWVSKTWSVNGHLKDACFTKPNVQDRCNSHSDNDNMGFETHTRMQQLCKTDATVIPTNTIWVLKLTQACTDSQQKSPALGSIIQNKKKRKLTSGHCISFAIILFWMYFTFVTGTSKLFGVVIFWSLCCSCRSKISRKS